MVRIGFDHTGEIYESYGLGLANLIPSSTIFTPAALGKVNEKPKLPHGANPSHIDWGGYFFREDFFDPVTRVRRGRLYKKDKSSHDTFHFSYENHKSKNLLVFHSIAHQDLLKPLNKIRVYLGLEDVKTEWLLLQAEPISTGEVMLTLKSVSYFGIIPEIDSEKLPNGHENRILEKNNKLINDFHVATPTAIIELARDAAAEVMNALVLSHKISTSPLDLSESSNLYSKHCLENKISQHFNVYHSAKVIANLHVQNKSVSQLKNDFRPLDEGDAELAVRCLGHMFRDLGWERLQ